METLDLFEKYIEEREGKKVYKDPQGRGFIIFKIENGGCFIKSIFVLAEHRRSGVGTEMADAITDIALLNGCTYLLGTVDPRDKSSTDSLKAQLFYGFKVCGIDAGLIFLKKDIGG